MMKSETERLLYLKDHFSYMLRTCEEAKKEDMKTTKPESVEFWGGCAAAWGMALKAVTRELGEGGGDEKETKSQVEKDQGVV